MLGPLVLLADEPTSHQDEAGVVAVAGVLRTAADRGSACLVATHHESLLRHADRVINLG